MSSCVIVGRCLTMWGSEYNDKDLELNFKINWYFVYGANDYLYNTVPLGDWSHAWKQINVPSFPAECRKPELSSIPNGNKQEWTKELTS